MAVVSIVPYNEITEAARWDAEFYQPYFRELGQKLQRSCKQTLADFASPSDATFDPASVDEFNYAEISRVDSSCGQIETIRVKSADTPDRAQTLLKGGEVLVSTVRPNRSLVGLVPYGVENWVATSGFAALLASDKRYRSTLFAWLKTKEITDWLDRHTTASMYPAVSAPDIFKSPFPHLSDSVLNRIHDLVSSMELILENGRKCYPEAEIELLERIGWQDLNKQPRELYYTENFQTLTKQARIDAESMHPKYHRLLKQLDTLGASSVTKLCYFNKHGIQPPYVEGGTIPIITQRQFSATSLCISDVEHWTDSTFLTTNPDFALRRGDVLVYSVSAGDYLGQTNLYDEVTPSAAASFVTILRTNQLVPAYLALFLNSPAGTLQTNSLKRGTSPFYLYPRDLALVQVFVPQTKTGKVDLTWQEKLADKVLAAARAKIEACAKLEEAKRIVETSIS